MSIRLQTGFRVKTKDINRLMRWVNAYRNELKELVDIKQAKYVASRAASFIDRCTIFEQMGELKKSSAYARAVLELQERQQRVIKEGRRDPLVDFEVELILFPLGWEEPSNHVLGVYFTEHKDLADIWMSKKFVEEYGYWTDTDKPESMSEEGWKKREVAWATAMKQSYIPMLSGFRVMCSSLQHMTVPLLSEAMNHIPDLKSRAEGISMDITFSDFMKKLPEGTSPVTEYTKFKDWIETEEGKLVKEERLNLILKNLKLTLNEFDLNNGDLLSKK